MSIPNPFHILKSGVFVVIECRNTLNFVGILLLSDILFANNIFHFVNCAFTLLEPVDSVL